MAIVTDYPSGIGASDSWTLTAGASKIIAVGSGDQTDATYITTAALSADLSQLFTFPSLPPAQNPVASCTMSAITRNDPTNPTSGEYWVYDGSNWQAAALTSTYELDTFNHYSLDPALINAASGGVRTSGIDKETRCTQIYRTTNYTPATDGGFTFLMSLLLPLLGAGVIFESFESAVKTLRNMVFDREERIGMWNAWREYRYPTYHDLVYA